jgi:hypothetical protein
MVPPSGLATSKAPCGWIEPGMWIGSRSQAIRSSGCPVPVTSHPLVPVHGRVSTRRSASPRKPPSARDRGQGSRSGGDQSAEPLSDELQAIERVLLRAFSGSFLQLVRQCPCQADAGSATVPFAGKDIFPAQDWQDDHRQWPAHLAACRSRRRKARNQRAIASAGSGERAPDRYCRELR